MSCILIVDDSSSTRIAMKVFLQREGHSVVLAEDGRRGLEALEDSCPDAVLMDVIMPDMDGYTMLHCIRTHSDQKIRTIPVIAMTGRDKLEELLQGLGVQGFVRKHSGCFQEIAAILADVIEATDSLEERQKQTGASRA
jgi:CheY-like chemotaxis protein